LQKTGNSSADCLPSSGSRSGGSTSIGASTSHPELWNVGHEDEEGTTGGWTESEGPERSGKRMGRVPSFFTSPSSENLREYTRDSTPSGEAPGSTHASGSSGKVPAELVGYSGHAVVDQVNLMPRSQDVMPSQTSVESLEEFDGSMTAFYYSGGNRFSRDSLVNAAA